MLADQLTEDEGALTRFLVNSSQAVTALAERRDDLSGLVTNANETAGAIARRERRALARAGAAADHAAARQHDVREPARHARRPRRAGRRVQARHQGPRAVPARAAPAGARRAPDDPRPAHADPPQRRRQRPRRGDAQDAARCSASPRRRFRNGQAALQRAQPVLEFIRPYTPDFVGWLRDFGQGAANYDANGHFARIQPIFNAFSFADNPAGGVLTPIPPAQRFDGLETGVVKRCPGAATQPPAGRLGALHRRGQPRPRRLRPEPRAPRPVMRVLVPVLLRRRRRRGRRCCSTRDGEEPYKVRAIFDNAGFVIPGEDVKVAGVKVGKIDCARRHATTSRPSSCSTSTTRPTRTSAATPSARSARSR